jgi:hypothetical protein
MGDLLRSVGECTVFTFVFSTSISVNQVLDPSTDLTPRRRPVRLVSHEPAGLDSDCPSEAACMV